MTVELTYLPHLRSWVGIFSVVFLHRRLTRAQWVALVVCVFGVAVVGSSSLIGKEPAEPEAQAEDGSVSPLVGIALILVAQLFSAFLRVAIGIGLALTDTSIYSCFAIRHRGTHHGAPCGRTTGERKIRLMLLPTDDTDRFG